MIHYIWINHSMEMVPLFWYSWCVSDITVAKAAGWDRVESWCLPYAESGGWRCFGGELSWAEEMTWAWPLTSRTPSCLIISHIHSSHISRISHNSILDTCTHGSQLRFAVSSLVSGLGIDLHLKCSGLTCMLFLKQSVDRSFPCALSTTATRASIINGASFVVVLD